VSWKSPV